MKLTMLCGAAVVLLMSGCFDRPPDPELAAPAQAASSPDQSFVDCFAGDPVTLVGSPAAQARLLHINGLTRVIAPGVLVTQDYDPKRLNLVTDADDTVTRIYCG